MKTQFISTENLVFEYFKRTMYALMVIVIAVAIPVLSYLELSYNSDNGQDRKENTENVQNFASSAMKQNMVKL